ncbi:hypothetical protein FGO68_gene5987 [Halteria grandinella]|uniref:Protein phosphatase 1 regulatory subunit 21 N-terminal domain-containing protein n=1 Tax=Halteria grandinella TaxID=5974 RepID=A0A8J8NYW2_HALGN|nr:hypothetical protein FGO68_gene5987 [Halteria grandinella]
MEHKSDTTQQQEQYVELKAKYKQLQKFAREINSKNEKLEAEVSQLRIANLQQTSDIENQEFKVQQLIKRVEALQKKNEQLESALKSGSTSGGWSIFGGGSSASQANLKEQYDQLNELYQVAQEDLQIKIEEIELEHQKQFNLNSKFEHLQDEMLHQKKIFNDQVDLLQVELASKALDIEGLKCSLLSEQGMVKGQIQTIAELRRQAEEQKIKFMSELQELQGKVGYLQATLSHKVPFDPFREVQQGTSLSKSVRHFQKSNQRDFQQLECVRGQLVSLVDKIGNENLVALLNSIQVFLDGQRVVVNEEGTGGNRKFMVYIEKILGLIAGMQELLESVTSQLKSHILISLSMAVTKSPRNNPLPKFGQLVVQFLDYLINYLDEQAFLLEGQEIGQVNESLKQVLQQIKSLIQKNLSSIQLNVSPGTIIQDIGSIKDAIFLFIKHFKTKIGILKSKKFNIELKSSNLHLLGQELLSHFHSLIQNLSALHSILSEQSETQFQQSSSLSESRHAAIVCYLGKIDEQVNSLDPSVAYEEYVTLREVNKSQESKLEAMSEKIERLVEDNQGKEEIIGQAQRVENKLKSVIAILKSKEQPQQVEHVQQEPESIGITQVFKSTKDLYLFDQVSNGFASYQMQLLDSSTQAMVPLTTLNCQEQVKHEACIKYILQLTQKLATQNKISAQYSQTDFKLKEQSKEHSLLQQELQRLKDLQADMEESQANDKILLSKGYEEQLKVMSEHIVELSLQLQKEQ